VNKIKGDPAMNHNSPSAALLQGQGLTDCNTAFIHPVPSCFQNAIQLSPMEDASNPIVFESEFSRTFAPVDGQAYANVLRQSSGTWSGPQMQGTGASMLTPRTAENQMSAIFGLNCAQIPHASVQRVLSEPKTVHHQLNQQCQLMTQAVVDSYHQQVPQRKQFDSRATRLHAVTRVNSAARQDGMTQGQTAVALMSTHLHSEQTPQPIPPNNQVTPDFHILTDSRVIKTENSLAPSPIPSNGTGMSRDSPLSRSEGPKQNLASQLCDRNDQQTGQSISNTPSSGTLSHQSPVENIAEATGCEGEDAELSPVHPMAWNGWQLLESSTLDNNADGSVEHLDNPDGLDGRLGNGDESGEQLDNTEGSDELLDHAEVSDEQLDGPGQQLDKFLNDDDFNAPDGMTGSSGSLTGDTFMHSPTAAASLPFPTHRTGTYLEPPTYCADARSTFSAGKREHM
jgi:ribosomal protein L20